MIEIGIPRQNTMPESSILATLKRQIGKAIVMFIVTRVNLSYIVKEMHLRKWNLFKTLHQQKKVNI